MVSTEELMRFDSSTRFFTIATAGHVDHGKTSLLRQLTGIDPDRLKEEKERQMTTDLGFAYLPLGSGLVLGFVDVPGHGKFLKNMLAGVGGIDLALLVVAADEGPMPQTIQHVRILSLLGVTQALVAITKIDLAEGPEQIDLVREESGKLLDAHGIKALGFCSLSSSTGEGFEELKNRLKELLSSFPERQTIGNLLLPVDRVFSKSGFGTVITGTLVSGQIAVGDQIFVEPGNLKARVRRLETHGQVINQARPGQRVACNVVVKEGEKLSRGFVLSGEQINPSKTLIVSLFDRPRLLSQDLSERLSDQPIRLYHGTAEYQGFLRWVEDCKSDRSGAKGEAQEGVGFIGLQKDAVLSAQDHFVIRLTDDTIYGGSILLRDRPKWLSKGEILELAALLSRGQLQAALLRYLNDAPQLMLKEAQLSTIIPESLCKSVLETCIANKEIVRLGEYLVTFQSRQILSDKLLNRVTELLGALEDPTEGVTLESLRQKLQPKLERTAFQTLLEEESALGRVLRKGDKVMLPSAVSVEPASSDRSETEGKILDVLKSLWCIEIDELSVQSGIDLKLTKSTIQNLTKTGTVMIVSYDFVSSKEKIAEAHQVLADLWNAKRSIAPTDFKEKIGVTRKYAMALLQYFDDSKITRRLDSGRVLLKGPGR